MVVGRVESASQWRGVRRGVTVGLAVTLLCLTAAAVLGGWRQALLVRAATQGSARTDVYQRAAFLAAREFALVQGALAEPGGVEHTTVTAVSGQLQATLDELVHRHAPGVDLNRELAGRHRRAQTLIAGYLALLERGRTSAARQLLEQRIEPLCNGIQDRLLDEQAHQLAAYTAGQARAERDSRILLAGTVVSFAFGWTVIGVLARSGRRHRRLIAQLATCDPLTGLPNRAGFHTLTEPAFTAASPGAAPPTVLVLDLDGFKDVNDNLGHPIGDLLLTQVAARLRDTVRGQDIVARLGGDEFAVLLHAADPAAGERAAARITDALAAPFLTDGITLDIEASVGIATAGPGQDLTTVLRHADTAMHTAKQHRLGHTHYDPTAAHHTASRLTLLGDLRRALDHPDEITLHYQPKIALDSGHTTAVEALARWHHPDKGPIPPGQFIPVLETTHLIHRFTRHVLTLAARQARRWADTGHPTPIAVNISTRCLLDTTLPDTIAAVLDQAGIPGQLLGVEVTENTVMANPDHAITVLHRIRALGVNTAIDDYGTGYSSMTYLKLLPLDELKIDQSFVRDLATDPHNHALVASAIDLGHNLGLTVVAEGVEDQPTATTLTTLGCDLAQGYHYARPLPANQITQHLTRHPTPTP